MTTNPPDEGYAAGYAAGHAAGVEASPWKPTHRHYKGTLYREVSRGIWSGNDEINGRAVVAYDNAEGRRFYMLVDQWESAVAGVPRYTALDSPSGAATAEGGG